MSRRRTAGCATARTGTGPAAWSGRRWTGRAARRPWRSRARCAPDRPRRAQSTQPGGTWRAGPAAPNPGAACSTAAAAVPTGPEPPRHHPACRRRTRRACPARRRRRCRHGAAAPRARRGRLQGPRRPRLATAAGRDPAGGRRSARRACRTPPSRRERDRRRGARARRDRTRGPRPRSGDAGPAASAGTAAGGREAGGRAPRTCGAPSATTSRRGPSTGRAR